MKCKFLSNGLALQYHDFMKPCCTWDADAEWRSRHQLDKIDLSTWHDHPDLVQAREQLENDEWPNACKDCKTVESQGRKDSMRLNAESAYSHYNDADLTLEIRPGSVCNFACQTCWTAASTRVAHYYKQAGIPDPFEEYQLHGTLDYNLLLPVADRLKNIVILGGEPFYDPECIKLIKWCTEHTTADITMFTNGSVFDQSILDPKRKYTIVFSMDAVGKPAEYIRFGTVWEEVLANFELAKTLLNVEVRVNITTSVYNYSHLHDLIKLLVQNWPSVVSFGRAAEEQFTEQVIPFNERAQLIDSLNDCVQTLESAVIEKGQKSNAVNAVTSIIYNLEHIPYNKDLNTQFTEFVEKMDKVKKISV